jgi:hypothetical protein
VFNYAKSKYTHMYIENLVKYVVSVIDYNISLFRTASRLNYAIIDYTMLQSASNFVLINVVRLTMCELLSILTSVCRVSDQA